jgi:hypothetical protein
VAIALVGSAALANINAGTVSATTVTRAFTAGNCAIAVASIFRQTTFTVDSVTDGAGNTWNLLTVGTADATGLFQRLAVAYAMNVAAGSATVSFNLSSSAVTISNTGVSEFSGVATASALDDSATNSEISTAAADVTAGPIDTTEAGDLIYGAACVRAVSDTNVNFGSPTNFTNIYRQNNSATGGQAPSLDAAYWLPGAVQTNFSPAWTHDNAAGTEGIGIVLALKAAAAAVHLHRIIGGGGNRVIS